MRGDEPAVDDALWRGAAAPATEASFADLAWWDATTDPVLKKLVAEALEKNQDLKIAAARVEEYRAYAGINPLWPTMTNSGDSADASFVSPAFTKSMP